MVFPSSCVFGCVICISSKFVLSDVLLNEGWPRLVMVLVVGDWAVPQQHHFLQPSRIPSLSCLVR